MLPFDPLALDRDLSRGARASRHFLRALEHDLPLAEQDLPFAGIRWVSTKTTFDALSRLEASDPLRDPFRRWVFVLALVRIAREPLLLRARAFHEETIRLERPAPTQTSARDLILRILRERSLDARALWIEGLSQAAPRITSASRACQEAFVEIARRLGVDDPWSMWLGFEHREAQGLARDLLIETEDLAGQLFGGTLSVSAWLELALAREVKGSWPTRPERLLPSLFGGTPLWEGLDIQPGAMPEILGASSLVRAFARFGAAYAEAAAPRGGLFALRHDPRGLRPLRRGALFGSLLAEPVFLRRMLGLSRDEARQSARALARSLLGAVRLEAARTLSFTTAIGDLEELHSVALHAAWPLSLASVLPRSSPWAPLRLVAALEAARDRAWLIDRFDEDWFRNPHALRHLREEDGTLAPAEVDPEALRKDLPAFTSILAELA